MGPVFEIDGELLNVDILSYERIFEMPLTEQAVTTMDGTFHWESIHPKDKFRLVFRARPGYEADMELLYRLLRRKRTHACAVPQHDGILNVMVFVTNCKQRLEDIRNGYRWGQLEVEFFIAEGVSQWN